MAKKTKKVDKEREAYREGACAALGGNYVDGKCVSENPGKPIPLPRYNPAGKKMPTQAEKGLRKAERNYPRPSGKKFPVSKRRLRP